MGNKALGIADPGYDALRIYSGQSIAPDLGGGSTGGGGVENKIYVWHADGSTIDTFDPDAAGLALALAAAVSGDTVKLPSIAIALTAAITVAAGVTVSGLSDAATLSFSGIAGGGITLSSGSLLQTLTVLISGGASDVTCVVGPGSGTARVVSCKLAATTTSGTPLAASASAADTLFLEDCQLSAIQNSIAVHPLGASGSYTLVDTLVIDSANAAYQTGTYTTVVGRTYRLDASGSINWDTDHPTDYFFDAQWVTSDNWSTKRQERKIQFSDGSTPFATDPTYSTIHAYSFTRNGTGSAFSARLVDGDYSDNSGSITLTIYELPGSIVNTEGCEFNGDFVGGILQWGDRSAWDTATYYDRHASDIDDHTFTYHNDPDSLPTTFLVDESNVSNPPTQAELVTALGSPTVANPHMYVLNDAGLSLHEYLCVSDGHAWHYLPLVKAAGTVTPTVTVVSTVTLATGGSPLDWHGRAAVKKLPSGVLVLVYYNSSAHPVNDGALHIKFSDDDGATWTARDTKLGGGAVTGFPMNPSTVSAGEDAGDGWLYLADNGNLILHMWRVDYGVTANGTYQSISTDGGATWSTSAQVNYSGIADDSKVFATDSNFVYGGVIYAAARQYDDPVPTNCKNIFIKSTDNGATWEYVSDISSFTVDTIEVGIEYLGNNTIIAILRDLNNTYTYKSVSTNMGVTWSALSDVTSVLQASGRHRIYTRSHLKGLANWWTDPVLIMSGFQLMTPGSSQQRRNCIWISQDAGATWSGPFYTAAQAEDGGYGDLFYDATNDRYVFVSYYGTLLAADLVQYNLRITGI